MATPAIRVTPPAKTNLKTQAIPSPTYCGDIGFRSACRRPNYGNCQTKPSMGMPLLRAALPVPRDVQQLCKFLRCAHQGVNRMVCFCVQVPSRSQLRRCRNLDLALELCKALCQLAIIGFFEHALL